MHEDAPTLTAEPRERVGSRESKRVRARGGLPAVVYGHKEDPVSVTLDARDTLLHLHRGERIFQLQMGGQTQTQVVLVKDIQFDHLGTNPIHVDLARVSLTERVHANIPVKLKGDAKGLKAAGAVMLHPVTEVEIECEVRHLPEHLDVDISHLGVNEVVTAGEIPLPEGSMKLLTDPTAVLAQIVWQAVVETGEEEEVTAEGGEPEVIGAKEREEEEEEKKDED